MDLIDPPLALLAGVLTIASPCVLPLLPVVLGSSVERAGRLRPLFIVAGFVLAFAALGILLGLLSHSSGQVQEAVRSTSIVLLALFGLARLWPRPYDWLMARLGGPVQRVAALGANAGSGNAGGFLLGMSLGAVWTPCAGPVLASILLLAARAQDVGQSSLLLLLYAIGAGIPMLAIAYGGKLVVGRVRRVARHAASLQRAFGVLLILTAAAIYFQYDVLAYAWIAGLFGGAAP
ncbi:cytochrome C biogenesis protein [Bordetella genomosp. 9]|uniref:Cytochrome C biogenesis protein n=1 Tax=Bordetella genomosp. 9 TaxID=1416803 RepID=A0A261RQB1_9BORD|nr:cytochrome c biogenesis CcdA family protein [Bordetella genomosp. 9]OZI26483.1 cytochrome C biogenesis protein [Bordetella genomosp. 9]